MKRRIGSLPVHTADPPRREARWNTRWCFLALTLVALSASPSAKGETLRIVVSGAALPSPIDVRDPVALRSFTTLTEGFIVDWAEGPAAEPTGLEQYDVTFHVSPRGDGRPRSYRVSYVYDPVREVGYVHLPSRGQAHGESADQWFIALPQWNTFVMPLVSEAAGRIGQRDSC